MSYEKHPTHACKECHKSFKNKRALRMHVKDVHAEKPVQEDADRLVSGRHTDYSFDRSVPLCTVDADDR